MSARAVEVLTRPATFVINSVGVWGVDLLAFYLAVYVDAGWGLIALYLPAVNAVGHIIRQSSPASTIPACGPRSSGSCP